MAQGRLGGVTTIGVCCILLSACQAKLDVRARARSVSVAKENRTDVISLKPLPSLTNETQPLFQWQAFPQAVRYRVSLHKTSCDEEPLATAEVAALEWRSPFALTDGSYVFCVMALGSRGPLASQSQAFTVKTSLPGAFALVGPPRLVHRARPEARWQASADAVRYDAWISASSDCATVVQGPVSTTAVSLAFDALAPGVYHACAAAVDGAGNRRPALASRAFRVGPAIVLGQTDFASNGEDPMSARSMRMPGAFWTDGERVVVADAANHRVLLWQTFPLADGAPADIVLGQPDFVTGTANTGGVSAQSLNSPLAVASDGTRLFVADYGNNRVLIWRAFPTRTRQAADVVIGQPDMGSQAIATTRVGMERPSGVAVVGQRLFVADDGNNRILVYDGIPDADGAPASLVLGQADFTGNAYNAGGISLASIADPGPVFADADHLLVADSGNNRILMWTPLPKTNQEPATLVLGQPDGSSDTYNNGGIGPASMAYPIAAAILDGTLLVAERENNRVLRWDPLPRASGAAANAVYGQADFTSADPGLSASAFNWPQNIFACDGMFMVPELLNNRVLILPLE